MTSSASLDRQQQHHSMTYDSSLRLITPSENYRCPVSTPANHNHYLQKNSRIRRTKPMTVLYSQPTTDGVRPERSKGLPQTRHSRSLHRQPLPANKSLDYYFVDKNDDRKVEEQTNGHWLKALVSQPVEEILKKYRRKSEVKRTRIIWSKTFTTPGERSLLQAWGSNDHVTRGRVRVNHVQSAIDGPRRPDMTRSARRKVMRQTQSEPPLSRAQNNLELISGSVTPATMHRDEDARQYQNPLCSPRSPRVEEVSPRAQDTATTPRKSQVTMLSPSDHYPRVQSYTTQYFAPRPGVTGAVRVRIVASPEHLPALCTRHRVANLIQGDNVRSSGGGGGGVDSGSGSGGGGGGDGGGGGGGSVGAIIEDPQ